MSVELHLMIRRSLFQDMKTVNFFHWIFYTHAFYYVIYALSLDGEPDFEKNKEIPKNLRHYQK